MKIYDISQELLSSEVYPGDTQPTLSAVKRIAEGDLYNLTDLSLCAHNGTHIDAPFHFLGNGKTVEHLSLQKMVGMCCVISFDGEMTAEEALRITEQASDISAAGARRLLLKGNVIITPAAARVFAVTLDLIGVESQSVGDAEHPMEVHKILLGEEVVLLEGIRLGAVADGLYFLSAAPLAVAGADGAPCRAVLVEGVAEELVYFGDV